MTVERTLRLIAGSFILLSLVLGHYVSPYWYFFTAFVGLKSVSVGIHELVPDDDVSA
jgi:dolichol kinase